MADMMLSGDETAYSDMKKAGCIVIEYSWEKGAQVIVDRFEYEKARTCRSHTVKVIAWVRDVLAAAVEADRLIPGSHLASVRGIDQEELEAEPG